MIKTGRALAIVGALLAWEQAARAQSADTTPPPAAVPTADPSAAPAVAPSSDPAPAATTSPVEPAPPPPPAAPPPVLVVPVQQPEPAVLAAPADTAPSPAKVDDGDDGNWLDYLRLGAVAGVGFPRPLSILGMAKIDRVVSIGVEYSLLPQITINDAQTTFWAILGDVRVFPFRDSFFIGIAAGHQRVGASAVFVSPYPAIYPSLSEEVVADTWLINPRIGFLKTWVWGLTLGIDVGVQIPLSSSFSSTAPGSISVPGQSQPVSIPVNSDANNVAHTLGTSVLPTVDLLRIGLLL